MKKFLIVISVILVFTLASCSNFSAQKGNTDDLRDSQVKAMPKGSPDVLDSFQEPPTQEIPTQASPTPAGIMINQDVMYLTFEETIALATNIVKAQFESTIDCGTYYEYKFLIETQMKGNIEEDYLFVYSEKNVQTTVPEKGIIFDNNQSKYTMGESYILILERHVSVYNDHDRYMVLSGTFLPATDTSELYIYGNETLDAHSQLRGSDTKNEQGLLTYLSTEVAKNPVPEVEFYGTPYITSENRKDIVNGSDYVLQLVPEKQIRTLADNKTAIYQCDVIKQYKGEIEARSIEVKFVIGSVALGQEYLVALNDSAVKDLYIISSKTSVMDMNQENEVLNSIGTVE